jgi:hypothetical protein
MAVTDTALKGLYVEAFPTGGIAWRYRYRINGKREKLTLGKYPDLTLKNARRKRDEAAQLAAIGASPAERKRLAKVAATGETTVARFSERFYREIQARDRKDNPTPRRYIDKDILPFIGQKPMCEITTEDVWACWRRWPSRPPWCAPRRCRAP